MLRHVMLSFMLFVMLCHFVSCFVSLDLFCYVQIIIQSDKQFVRKSKIDEIHAKYDSWLTKKNKLNSVDNA